MKDNLTRAAARYQRTFMAFTTGQKVVAIVGTGALLLAGFMIFRWASTPSYAPLYSNLSSSDASAARSSSCCERWALVSQKRCDRFGLDTAGHS